MGLGKCGFPTEGRIPDSFCYFASLHVTLRLLFFIYQVFCFEKFAFDLLVQSKVSHQMRHFSKKHSCKEQKSSSRFVMVTERDEPV